MIYLFIHLFYRGSAKLGFTQSTNKLQDVDSLAISVFYSWLKSPVLEQEKCDNYLAK